MKIFKRVLVGTASLFVMGLLFVAVPKHAAAAGGSATLAELKKCNASPRWVDYAHISCQLSNNKTIVFTKSNPDQNDDSGHYVFAPPAGVFCWPDPSNYFSGALEGLVVQPNHNFTVINFNEGYLDRGKSGCQSFDTPANGFDLNGNETAPIKASAHSLPDGRSAIVLAGSAKGAQSLPGVTDGKFAGYDFVRWKSDYDPKVSGTKVYLFAQHIALNALGSDCAGDILAVTADKNDSSAGAREYTLGPSGDPLSSYSDLNKLPSAPNCYVSSTNFGSGDLANTQIYMGPQITKMAAISEGDVTGGSTTGGTGGSNTSGDNSDCVGKNSSSGLEWLLCPITTSLEKAADKLDGQIEAQLHFDTKDSLPTNGPVHLTWAIIKNISSGLIVVLLLVMVIAQAMGGGPFEAYTIRKMLPKLVAAVILMQISWPLCVWLIGLANDFGKGIGQLLTLPFGGGGSLQLNNILANAHWSTLANTALPVAVLAVGIVAVVDLPATCVVLFGLLVGLLAAFMVLLFRNVMIMALVIFSPLAFLASTMSGTDKLWKQWKDNFMKLLAMFPLIIAMIYVGRVFAWIVAQQTTDPGLLNYMGVLVAYFGPYFLIFKAYKWGGSMMAAAGEGINKGVNKVAERPRKLLEDRAKQHQEGKAIAAADRLSRWQSLNRRQKALSMARGDKFRSGEWDPTMMTSSILRHERQVKKAKFIAAGPKHTGELIEAETSALMARLGNYDRNDHDAIRQAIIMGTTVSAHLADGTPVEFNGARPFGATRTPAQLQAALDRGVVHGHWKAIEGYLQREMVSGDQKRMAAATAFLDRNAQTIGAEMPHLLKGLNLAATSKPEAISRMRQEEIESILANLHSRISTGVDERGNPLTPAQIDTARENLSIFLRNYAAAATDSRLKTQMDSGGAKVVKAYASSNAAVLAPLNNNPGDGRVTIYGLSEVPDHVTAGAAIPPHLQNDTDQAILDITGHITDEGIIH